MCALILYIYVLISLLYASWKFGFLMFDVLEVITKIVSTKFVGKKKRRGKFVLPEIT